jgi:hypothetical protein
MKLNPRALILRPARTMIGLAWVLAWAWLPAQAASPNVVIWDTGSRFGPTVDLKDRSEWTAVPADITALETDPAKASSDPGYYGRAYSFRGDAVVENSAVTAVFEGDQGKVALFSHPLPEAATRQDTSARPQPAAELLLVQGASPATRIKEYVVRRNANDEVILEITAFASSSKEVTARFSFSRSGTVGVKPGPEASAVRLLTSIDYGVAPAFIGDDLIVSATDAEEGKPLALAADNLFLGLVRGEAQMLVMTWPAGKQSLQLGSGPEPGRQPAALDFQHDGKSLYLSVLEAPGIWHKETLAPSYLEKDARSSWQRPFPANWKTLLTEAGVKATFTFRESKGQVWRGVPGSYIYPVWFDGDHAMYHLSKKVPPEGESLVYFLESNGTPAAIPTPADILRSTLGLDAADAILDPPGRQLRTHHRRAGAGVHRACTCGCTEAIQAVFESGEEVQQRDYVDGAVRDMVFFVEQHVARIEEYQKFARELLTVLKVQESSAPALKEYAENLAAIAQQILQEFDAQKDNMKSLSYAQELVTKTMRLTEKKDKGNLEAFMQLLKDWRAMGGAQDYVVAQCHVLARKLFQEAGVGALHEPRAVPLAKDVRARCRQVLRNPDGYEIWANY